MERRPAERFTFRYAASGIWYGIRTQRNLRIHLVAAVLAIGAAAFFQLSAVKWAVLLLMICLVISLELVNTALESVVDLVTSDWKQLAKAAKDTAAGAVLVAAIFAVLIGAVLFYEPVLSKLGLG
ncbi:diacylglycerol kinase [Paenibacillus sp. CAA11]|uniref:diacylglycerol kinase family protein n=1 Tax=Paenibacillus sp. CAA11 TaxID=1532905 RepID=UPI000D39818D|nr:diacylglycerol kinase family protein [Paenibacillus sp. CAA11]AWB45404.1 diacylglycerol kinase [Paenibacillus sp. CAA11]